MYLYLRLRQELDRQPYRALLRSDGWFYSGRRRGFAAAKRAIVAQSRESGGPGTCASERQCAREHPLWGTARTGFPGMGLAHRSNRVLTTHNVLRFCSCTPHVLIVRLV